MAGNVPDLVKDKIQEAQQTSNKDLKEIHAQTRHNQTAKNQRRSENLEISQRKSHGILRRGTTS